MSAAKKMKRPKKATNRPITSGFLQARVEYSAKLGYSKQKWVEFCEAMMAKGFECILYEARRTVSKYITVRDPKDHSRNFKVRFSNHRPIQEREAAGDCDFFVGITNLGTQTTGQAIRETFAYFERKPL